MAAKKNRSQDRQFMDAAGAPPDSTDAKNFLQEAAEDDKLDAKAKHLNKALRTSKDLVANMGKAIAHGLCSDSDDIKRACIDEVADLGNATRDACRAGLRAAGAEKRNVQD